MRRTDTADDLVACSRLAAEYHGENPRTALVKAQQHVAEPRNVLFLASDIYGRPVGFARITWLSPAIAVREGDAPPGYYLGGLVIAPAARRRGVGTRLTNERLRFIAERADEAWYVVNDANDASIDLHVAQGFHETTREFVFPGLVVDGPGSILCHRRFTDAAGRCQGCPTG